MTVAVPAAHAPAACPLQLSSSETVQQPTCSGVLTEQSIRARQAALIEEWLEETVAAVVGAERVPVFIEQCVVPLLAGDGGGGPTPIGGGGTE